MGTKTLATLISATLVLTVACSGGGEEQEATLTVNPGDATETGDAGDASESGGDEGSAGQAGQASEGPYVREMGLPLDDGRVVETEFEISAIERTEDSTAVYMSFTVSDDAPAGGRAEDFDQPPTLIDPRTGRFYGALVDDATSDDPEFYAVVEDANIPVDGPFGRPGDHVAMRVYYPSLPDDLETVTVVFYGMGFMTGIPMDTVDAHRPLTDLGREALPEVGRDLDGNEQELWADLLGFVESAEAATERAGDTETILLRSDVLFAFDDASLAPDARDVLEETAAAIQVNGADGTDVTIEGHTDGVGQDAYNQDLSLQRANAVRDELARLLGDGHSFDVAGRGSAEPVAAEGGPDDEQARARNRRVEISYTVETRAGSSGEGSGEASGQGSGGDGGDAIDVAERHDTGPAPFRPTAEPVATRTAGGWQLDVRPLVRDGAYLLCELVLTNNTGETAAPNLTSPAEDVPDEYRSNLGNFRLVEPETDLVRYVAAYVNPTSDDGEYDPAANSLREIAPGESFVGVVMYPAPSPDTAELTLRAGPFGDIPGIPVE
jgi:OOP family OmpA-OmpF porin